MVIEIPIETLNQLGKSESDLKMDFAIFLYTELTLSSAKCAAVAEVPRVVFLDELGKRKIPLHYDYQAFEEDLAVLNEPKP